ncbi:hypothetical protein [Daejeonella sp.]|uniref:hypothetical protein n=1 Tax=Daejeonella sp. TaxID=2805397 RepID=UPI0030BC37E4
MSRLKFTLLLLIVYTTQNVHAQKGGNTLAEQYQNLIMYSGGYPGYKQIRQQKVDLLWKNVSDTLAAQRLLLKEAKLQLGSDDQAFLASKAELENVKKENALFKARTGRNSVLGLYVETGTYNMIMWGIIFLLGAGLGFAIYRSTSALKEARYRTGLYNDLTGEFQKHKVNSNEKEKKLARELQTERNRLAEMSGR